MQYYIGSAKFIGLEISSNIGYRNIGKMSYRCNTNIIHVVLYDQHLLIEPHIHNPLNGYFRHTI